MRSKFAVATAIAFAFAVISCSPPTTGGLEPPPASITFNGVPLSVVVPGSATLTMTPSKAIACSSSWMGVIPHADGTYTYSVQITTVGTHTFSVTCTGEDGKPKTKEVMIDGKAPLVISGRVLGIFSGSQWLGNSRVYAIKGSQIDSVDVSLDGTFSIQTSLAQEDSVDLLIDEKIRANRSFFPALIALKKTDFSNVTIVRVPTQQVVKNGVYANQVRPISLDLAYKLDDETKGTLAFSFFYRTQLVNAWVYSKAYLDDSMLPIPTAFDRGASNQVIASSDSVGFWVAVDSAEKIWGENRFQPANFSDLPPTAGVRLKVDIGLNGAAFGGYSANPLNQIVGGSMVVVEVSLFSIFTTIAHELQHTSGYGHTCSWKTLMGNFCDLQLKSTSPTIDDVAYSELYRAVQKAVKVNSAKFGLPEAHQGERVYMLGLPREVIRY